MECSTTTTAQQREALDRVSGHYALIARGPGVAADPVVAEPASTLDLMSTFVDYAGASKPRDVQSRSLRGLLGGRAETRDVAYSEWYVHPSRCGSHSS